MRKLLVDVTMTRFLEISVPDDADQKVMGEAMSVAVEADPFLKNAIAGGEVELVSATAWDEEQDEELAEIDY